MRSCGVAQCGHENSTHARAKKETDHAGWCGHGAPRRASSVSFLLLACLRASILCSAGSALCSSLLHDQRCVVAKLTPVALLAAVTGTATVAATAATAVVATAGVAASLEPTASKHAREHT